MSMTGIRDMSVLEEPPRERMPVQTYVLEYDIESIKNAINRELARDGQVYYLHNRINNIEEEAMKLQLLIPEANVSFAHGQMSERELERAMLGFMKNEINVLVCTTIIETGLDISNVNTIIINDADHMGLSQLHQLRGRVGRSNKTSFAYLMYKKDKVLQEVSEKRLQTIKEFTEFGSGFKIAMRDLAIRGSGDILGGTQSGFIDSIGFEMYMKILQDAINEKMGKEDVEAEKEIKSVNVKVDGYIPHDYVSSDIEKLELYQRLDNAKTISGVDHLKSEFIDYYGKLPEEVSTLVEKRKLDILASTEIIENLAEVKGKMEITFTKGYSQNVKGDQLFELVNRLFTKPVFRQLGGKIVIVLPKGDQWLERINQLITTLNS